MYLNVFLLHRHNVTNLTTNNIITTNEVNININLQICFEAVCIKRNHTVDLPDIG